MHDGGARPTLAPQQRDRAVAMTAPQKLLQVVGLLLAAPLLHSVGGASSGLARRGSLDVGDHIAWVDGRVLWSGCGPSPEVIEASFQDGTRYM